MQHVSGTLPVYVTKFLWQNLLFCKEQASPKNLWDSPGSFIIIFFPQHNPAILIYIWPCSNIGFLFEDKLQGTLRVKKA